MARVETHARLDAELGGDGLGDIFAGDVRFEVHRPVGVPVGVAPHGEAPARDDDGKMLLAHVIGKRSGGGEIQGKR